MLNEDTVPFARPRRKKTTAIVQINASMPQKIQKNPNFKNMFSSITRRSSHYRDGSWHQVLKNLDHALWVCELLGQVVVNDVDADFLGSFVGISELLA